MRISNYKNNLAHRNNNKIYALKRLAIFCFALFCFVLFLFDIFIIENNNWLYTFANYW